MSIRIAKANLFVWILATASLQGCSPKSPERKVPGKTQNPPVPNPNVPKVVPTPDPAPKPDPMEKDDVSGRAVAARFSLGLKDKDLCIGNGGELKSCSYFDAAVFMMGEKSNDTRWTLQFLTAPGNCLDLMFGKTEPGSEIGTYSCNFGDTQGFRIERYKDGSFSLHVEKDEKKCADFSGRKLAIQPCDKTNLNQILKTTDEEHLKKRHVLNDNAPQQIVEHTGFHKETLDKVYEDKSVVVYFGPGVDKSKASWIPKRVKAIWEYYRDTFGPYGGTRLYAKFHNTDVSGDDLGGGHPARIYDESHDYRNALDIGLSPYSLYNEYEDSYQLIHLISHEVGHNVEWASNDHFGTPGVNIWSDSMFIDLLQIDLYRKLGWTEIEKQWIHRNTVEEMDDFPNFPKKKVNWMRDFWLRIYNKIGTAFIKNYFKLLEKHIPTDYYGWYKKREFSMGELLHFFSGAAGYDVSGLAKEAFGWKPEWTQELEKARKDYPAVTYMN